MAQNFKDEIKIDGKTILNIPLENIFYKEKEVKFESKWSVPNMLHTKTGLTNNVKFTPEGLNKDEIYFDPMKALIYKDHFLSITSKEQHKLMQQKKSKWGTEYEKVFHPVPLNVIPRNLNLEEIEYFIRLHRLEDLAKKQRTANLEVVDPEVRSPSPEPVYDPSGRRVNTLETRCKNSIILEKNLLIEECQKMNVGFLTPYDWKALKKTKKVFLPEIDNPELNFVNIVLGPKGMTQKLLEELSGCRISIRGRQVAGNKRNTVKDEEQTHVLVQSETDQDLEKGVEMVQKVLRGESLHSIAAGEKKYIKTGYEIMATEAVLRDYCDNCKEEGHKLWNCPYTFNENLRKRQEHFKNANNNFDMSGFKIVSCDICGSKTHLAKDCKHKNIAATEQTISHHMEFFKMMSELQEQEIVVEDLKPNKGNMLTNFITNYTDQGSSFAKKMIKEK